MKKTLLTMALTILSFNSVASGYFQFPVKSLKQLEGFDAKFAIESSKKMHEKADEIYLDCQSFINQISFYNRAQVGDNAGPVQTYDMVGYGECGHVYEQITELLRADKDVCVTLNINEYETPIVEDKVCDLE